MYLEFLKSLGVWIEALNDGVGEVDSLLTGVDGDLTCYVNHVPVIMCGELVGFISDDLGGVYHYDQATGPEQEWWDKRPSWKK